MTKFKLSYLYAWLFISIFISLASLTYFIYALNNLGLFLSLIFTILIFYFLKKKLDKKYQKDLENSEKVKLKWKAIQNLSRQELIKIISSLFFFFTSLLALFIISYQSSTRAAIISPWSQVPAFFWPILILNLLSLISLLSQRLSKVQKVIILSLHFSFIFSLAAILYKLSYGFDSFIHQANLNFIKEFGFIRPKNPYYIGLYAPLLLINKLSTLDFSRLIRFFIPLFSAFSLPGLFLLLNNSKEGRGKYSFSALAILSLLLLGFSPFIISHPQSFAYLFLIVTIIFALTKLDFIFILFAALASLASHPLAGLISLFIALRSYLEKRENSFLYKLFQNNYFIFLASFLISLVPIWLISGFSKLNFNKNLLPFLAPQVLNSESYILSLAYNFIFNYHYLIPIFLVLSYFLRKKIFSKLGSSLNKFISFLSFSALASFLAYILTSFLDFPDLISYEQGDYAKRLLIISLILLMPIFYFSFDFFIKKLAKEDKRIKLVLSISFALVLAISIYSNYPRVDNYYNSRSYSSSKTDLLASLKIEQLAQGEKYFVLANQQVSAIALAQFGFIDRYLESPIGELYFYAIPTGSKLYQYYLKMVYEKASKATMLEAMDFLNLNLGYFIINKYWWASDKIISEAKLSADAWWELEAGELYIFEYKKP